LTDIARHKCISNAHILSAAVRAQLIWLMTSAGLSTMPTMRRHGAAYFRGPPNFAVIFVYRSFCLPRDATQSAGMPQYAVRLSVRSSVRLLRSGMFFFHARWNTSKITSRLISLRFLLGLTPTWAICSNVREHPKNSGGMGCEVMNTNIMQYIYKSRAIAERTAR